MSEVPCTDADLQCYGVDGCRGGWIYACIADTRVFFGTVVGLEELVSTAPVGSCIFVDIPIGLPDDSGTGRRCDHEARQLLRPGRAASIFNAPIRSIVEMEEYSRANSTSKQLGGKGLSRQSFNIMPKIAEVDRLIRESPQARDSIRESHPELCFSGLAGGRPMKHSKKTSEGFQERLALLAEFLPGIERDVAAVLADFPRSIVAADDILDALVCALTASLSEHWKTVPVSVEYDSRGLAMEIVYCVV